MSSVEQRKHGKKTLVKDVLVLWRTGMDKSHVQRQHVMVIVLQNHRCQTWVLCDIIISGTWQLKPFGLKGHLKEF